ncbi:MAG: hypothetical protein J6D54_02965 [Olsenella sp.]|nr:hypothetical protein [Olsenella sp.]
MDVSGSQRALRMLSIVEIVCAAAAIAVGVVLLMAARAIDAADAATLSSAGLAAENAPATSAAFGIFGVVGIVIGIWSLLCGILGIRASGDPTKIGVVWTFTCIGTLASLAAVIASTVNGNLEWLLVTTAVSSGAMLWHANNIKKAIAQKASE